MLHNTCSAAAALWIALTLCGCGGSDLQRVELSGQVRYDGAPLPAGEIRFYPIEGTQAPMSGAVVRDGAYRVVHQGGVPVGKYRVEIFGYRANTTAPEVAEHEVFGGPPREQYLPSRYNVASKLTATVAAAQPTLDFDLQSNP